LAWVRDQSCQSDLWQRYLAAFHHYCQEANIVCEFARLNPFTGNQQYLQALTDGVQACNQIIYLDLTRSEETLWRGLNRGNRSNINKARRAGVRVAKDDQGEHVQSFYELYLATMRRNRATSWYDFSPDFFADSFTLLDDKISLFYATYHDQIIAAASFLHAGEVVHYFLGGSDSNYLDLRPNNLLMYQAICWAKNQGYRFFNLGGDYDRLTVNHQQGDTNYFPLYRANASS
jgi:serine/alanine adding enzyme